MVPHTGTLGSKRFYPTTVKCSTQVAVPSCTVVSDDYDADQTEDHRTPTCVLPGTLAISLLNPRKHLPCSSMGLVMPERRLSMKHILGT